jgi:hypothetical protein
MSANEQVWVNAEEKLKSAGVSDPMINQIQQVIDTDSEKAVNTFQKQLDIQKQLFSGKMSMKELAIEQLQIEYGISEQAAEQVYQAQNQIKIYETLRNLLQQMGEKSLSSLIDMAHELGEAFQDGAISSNEFGEALGNMVKRIVDALPQLLLSAGLQLMATNWKLGLAFIAASGLASFVSGMISDTSKDGTEDQLAKLQKIQDAISNLIDQQKILEEYYFKKRQELNAKAAMNVNDLIVTPQGTWSTHPDDYIIATKSPQTLNSEGGVQMNVKIVNNAGAVVTTQQGIGADGLNELLVMVDQRVQSNIASGKWDGSFAARENRTRGRNIRT